MIEVRVRFYQWWCDESTITIESLILIKRTGISIPLRDDPIDRSISDFDVYFLSIYGSTIGNDEIVHLLSLL
jgi:hypothetical protein